MGFTHPEIGERLGVYRETVTYALQRIEICRDHLDRKGDKFRSWDPGLSGRVAQGLVVSTPLAAHRYPKVRCLGYCSPRPTQRVDRAARATRGAMKGSIRLDGR